MATVEPSTAMESAPGAPAPARTTDPLTRIAAPALMSGMGGGGVDRAVAPAFDDSLHSQLTVGPIDHTVHLRPLSVAERRTVMPASEEIPDVDAGMAAAIGVAGAGGRYRLIREVGRGGMGVVYEALDLQLERSVAIKSLKVNGDRPSQLKRFLREARIASRLNHPGIMAIHEFGQTGDGRAFMVMRLLRGQTLRQILDARTGASDDLPRLLAAFLQACQAVASAHAAGVIHRDLKPANIMVGEYSLVTVMDWGLAKVLDDPLPEVVFTDDEREETPGEIHTACGTVFGTPGYLAPEQARGAIDRVDRRTDVFGLGCILCEILTGVPAYRGATQVEVWRQAEEGDTAAALARLEACDGPEMLSALARRCLAIAPEQRPADAGELVEALVAHLESGQRRAEQQLVRFFDLSVDLFCIASLSGTFLRVNDNAIRLLGHPESVLLSRKFLDFVHPDDQATTLAEVEKLGRGETTLRFCNRYRRADGHFVTLEWNARAVPEEGVIYAVARDVTALEPDPDVDRLRAERDGLLARVAALERMQPTEPLA
jgi:serine/threonine-protein kinase